MIGYNLRIWKLTLETCPDIIKKNYRITGPIIPINFNLERGRKGIFHERLIARYMVSSSLPIQILSILSAQTQRMSS